MTEPAAPTAQPDPRDQPGRVARNIVSVTVSQLTTWVFSAVSIVIVPRALGPEANGQLGFALAVWALAGIIVSFGSGQLVTRELSQDSVIGSRVVSNVLPMQGLAWLLMAVVVFGYVVVADVGEPIRTLLFIAGIGTLVAQWGMTYRHALTGRERLTFTSTMSIVERAVAAGIAVTAVLLGYGVEVVAAAGVIASVVALGVFGVGAQRDPNIVIRPSLNYADVVVKQAIPLMAMASALRLYREIDVIALKLMADDVAVGLYAATDRLLGAALMVPAAITIALFPTLSRRYATDPEGVRDTLRRVSGYLGVMTLPMAMASLFLGRDLAVTILGDQFEKAGDVMRIYGLVLIPVAWGVVIGIYCTISRRELRWAAVLTVLALLTIPLDIVLVPWTEDRFDNAALAGALAFFVTETGSVVYGFRKVLPGVFHAGNRRMLFRALLAAGVMAGVLWLLRDMHLAVRVAAGGLTYVACVPVFGVLSLSEVATLGGPFERFARFVPSRTDQSSEDGPSSPPTSSESA